MHPQKYPRPWTKVTSRHRTSTPGTLSVDRRLHFFSASTKTPLSVDKCHLLAPHIHTRHPLRGQAAAPGTAVVTESPSPVTNATPGTSVVTESPHSVTNATPGTQVITKSPHSVTNTTSGTPSPQDTQTKEAPVSRSLFCDPSGARTQDPNIKSVVLYLLS